MRGIYMNNEKYGHTNEGSMTVPLEKLTQPGILLLLLAGKSHGYELIQKLNQVDYIDGELEAATVYRTLRRMEQDGLIVSRWEHGEFGPARRQYEITGQGRATLNRWTDGLKARKKQIENFIENYNGLMGK